MRFITILATLLLTLAVAACSGIEVRPAPIDTFAAGNYTYYEWRSDPLPNVANSQDPMYIMDPILRSAVDADLRKKGYILDKERAQFSVDYFFASGLRMGERSAEASNLTPYPSVNPSRQINQAVVDNAYALGGVKETSNIALQFNDTTSKKEVWHVIITKIVEDVNKVNIKEMRTSVRQGVEDALETLPEAK
ncbi:MAG: DUF4136 domain-containing protein [Halioglobus sp.]|nr:DUF4136 domain-containing protein [Halioglobus sp.]MCB1708191.1 DUF4136 domain-containing protein [Halioglobus sp.]MCP5121380.1 DUF4136 domain-containing protein [Pseudomonadales bacterium]MCP5193280.1 DUF4136 domain-containing protein [Pseudomonadales bacterium]